MNIFAKITLWVPRPYMTLDSFMQGSYPASLRNVGVPTQLKSCWFFLRQRISSYDLYSVGVTSN